MNPVARYGPYALVRRIAASDVAVSFAARWLPIDDAERIVALRFLTGAATDDDRFAEAFEHAMRVASRLNHVNVAQTFDAARHEGHWYQSLEYVEGVPLSVLIDRAISAGRPLPTDVATFIAAEMCAALGYAHGRRDERGQPLDVIHADLRPRNVLLSRAGEVKVFDFGLARVWLDISGSALLDEDDRLQFAAPELARGEAWDRRVDVYSAGAIAWTLLAGRRPFEGLAGAELRGAVERGGVTPIRDVVPSVPGPLAETVMAALAPDPDARPSTAVEVRSALSAWLRRHAPGFGRHRLKMYLQKELASDMPPGLLDGSWRALHRKDFVPHDRSTVLDHEVGDEADGFSQRDDIEALLDPAAPDPDAAAPPALPRHQPPAPVAEERAADAAPAPHAAPRPAPPGPAPMRAGTPAAPTPAPARDTTPIAPEGDDEPGVRRPGETPLPSSPAARAPAETPSGGDPVAPDAEPDVPASTSETPVPRPVDSGPVRIREDRRAIVDEVTGRQAVNANVETFDEALAEELAGAVYDDEVAPDFGVAAVMEDREMRRAGRQREFKPVIATLVLVGLIVGAGVWAWQRNVAQPQDAAPAAEPDSASVFVTSRPHGAAISLDGTPTGSMTPAPLDGLEPGLTYTITLDMPGYEAERPLTVTAEAGTAPTLSAQLVPMPHTVDVITEPAGAEVWYDGEMVGVTPTSIDGIRADYRDGIEYVVRLEGYFDERVPATWEAGEASSAVTTVLRPDPNWVADDATTAGGR